MTDSPARYTFRVLCTCCSAAPSIPGPEKLCPHCMADRIVLMAEAQRIANRITKPEEPPR